MARVSVIIPLYNSEKYIRKCLDALVNQTYTDFEVIIVDDCSKDSSVEEVTSYICESNINNFHFIQNEKNLGPSLTRKKAIELASGDYIAFCDSDDYYEPDYLECMVNNSNSFVNDIVFCSYKVLYSSGKSLEHNVVKGIHGKSKREIIACGADSLCCLMIRKKILENLEYPNIRNGEDMSIIPVIISKAENFGFVEKPIYNYVYHENSLSKKPNAQIAQVLEISFHYIESNIGSIYADESEFLGIKNLLYGATLNILKLKGTKNDASEVASRFNDRYPNWINNKYFNSLPMYKKVYLFFVQRRMFQICRLLSIIHMYISK